MPDSSSLLCFLSLIDEGLICFIHHNRLINKFLGDPDICLARRFDNMNYYSNVEFHEIFSSFASRCVLNITI